MTARFADHPRPDRDDQAGVLGDGDERHRRDLSTRRVRPAQQRLEPFDLTARELHHRLVVEVELTAFQRLAQVVLEGESLGRPVPHRFVEHGHRVAPGFLRLVHRGVGVAKE